MKQRSTVVSGGARAGARDHTGIPRLGDFFTDEDGEETLVYNLGVGQLDGVMTGIRQLRRTRPLETEVVSGLRVPTLAEMARVKAWLLATRHTVRDYLDTVVLLERLGDAAAREAFASFDELYRQPTGTSPLAEVVERLAAAAPSDAPEIDLRSYKGLVAPWNDWGHLAARGRHWASLLATGLLQGGAG